jgi:hypothetical protein
MAVTWEVHEGTSGWLEIIADHGDHIYESIATLDPRNTCGVLEKKANHVAHARLIAAAPELLAALKQMVASAHPHPTAHPAMTAAWKVAHAAIAKAEGKQ